MTAVTDVMSATGVFSLWPAATSCSRLRLSSSVGMNAKVPAGRGDVTTGRFGRCRRGTSEATPNRERSDMQQQITRDDVWTFRNQHDLGSNVMETRADISGFKVEAVDGSIGKVDDATYEIGGSYLVVDT